MKSQLTLFALLSLTLVFVSGKCSTKCPDTEDVVWGIVGNLCQVFRNKCYFDKENCQRQQPLTRVSKEECQPKCPEICTFDFQSVTGIYRGVTREFSNPCQMAVHNCVTGETYLPVD